MDINAEKQTYTYLECSCVMDTMIVEMGVMKPTRLVTKVVLSYNDKDEDKKSQ